jgi:xanthine/CO dehydrogenase XdhC/CoxF family maturation factor
MTHELKAIFEAFVNVQNQGIKAVLASVVALDGSSYRKPGVRMLILENNRMIGAVSGGCVEKEILRQSQEVFHTGQPRMMTYDGRYRLGCEGVLFLLLEPFNPSDQLIEVFQKTLEERRLFEISSYYDKRDGFHPGIGSTIKLGDDEMHPIAPRDVEINSNNTLANFLQIMSPCFQLVIIGTEHDAVQLCLFAANTGWEVTIIGSPKDPRNLSDFPGAKTVLALDPGELDQVHIDAQTAVVAMTHNYASDLRYITGLKSKDLLYLGVLGPALRREKLLSEMIENDPEIDTDFLDKIHGPAGLNIGSETPQEIAISIVAEILSVMRDQQPMHLSELSHKNHA